MKLPWAKFYHADWRADAALAMCSPATRGIWMEMLCIMWQNNTDQISGTIDQLARLCRCTPAEVEAATKEIRSADVCETVNGGAVYTLISRRRSRELQVSKAKSDAGKQGGRPSASEKQTESKTKANEKAPSASASASASESVTEEDKDSGPSIAPPPPAAVPTLAEVRAYASSPACGFRADRVEEWFHDCEATEWRYARNWQAALRRDRCKERWMKPAHTTARKGPNI